MMTESDDQELILVEKSKYFFLISELERLDGLVKIYHHHHQILERHFINVNQIIEAIEKNKGQ